MRRIVATTAVVLLGAFAVGCSKSSDTSTGTTSGSSASPGASSQVSSTAAGGPSYGTASTGKSPGSTSGSPGGTTSAGAGAISTAKIPLGEVIVDGQGFTLYMFDKDTGGTSSCIDACAKAWPPATTTGAPTVGGGLQQSKVNLVSRPDGSKQIAYNGHPLYRFGGDTAAGETNGQGVGGVWYVAGANGEKIDKD